MPSVAKRLSGILPPAPAVHEAICAWAGYGHDYLNLEKGDVIFPLEMPCGVDPEGWIYGELRRQKVLRVDYFEDRGQCILIAWKGFRPGWTGHVAEAQPLMLRVRLMVVLRGGEVLN